MVQWAIKDMGGMVPRRDPHLLPDNMAETAINCDLASGPLDGLPAPVLAKDFTGLGTAVRKAYRFPCNDNVSPDAWLPLPSEFSSVCRSPLTNDDLQRLYWTNPNDGAYWSTYADIIAGNAPWNLGYIAPDDTYTPTVTAVGGTPSTSVPFVARSYLVTFSDQFGNESSPCDPSTVVNGAVDGVWTIMLLRTLPGQVAGKNYPLPITMNLYRTVTGATTGAAFYFVTSFAMATTPPPVGGYVDASNDTDIVNNLQLPSAAWNSCPELLDGLVMMAGGFLVGFIGNTVYFCEPEHPHAWPVAYCLSVFYEIQGLGVWQQSLMVMTKGFPSQGSGTSPSNFTLTQINVPEPCIARGSIVTDLAGIYYASQNGLVMLNYYGMQNQTLQTFTKNIWVGQFKAGSIVACRHRDQYLAINGTGTGFLIDYTEPREGVTELNTFSDAVAVWNDEYTGNAYICANKQIFLWDDGTQPSLTYRWLSKRFYLQAPINLGACQIKTDTSILTDTAPATPPLDNTDVTLVLPANVNCVLNVYADGVKRFTRKILIPQDIFGLPAGFLAYEWQVEIVSRSPVFSVELATTMKELRAV